MSNHKPIIFFIHFLLLLSLIPSYAGGNPRSLNNVVIISVDALHPEALQQAKIPTLSKLMQSGAYTLKGRSTEPPKTLIAHTAMFTGMAPGENGKVDNDWVPGEATVQESTIFDSARRNGFKTGYFYTKEKLGYLVNDAVNIHEWSRDNAIDLAGVFIKTPGRHFVFLHVSGLDQVGPEYGWLSPEYIEELSYIDAYLSSLIELLIDEKNYLIIVISDHAGHEKVHGSDHPQDYRLPLIVCSDTVSVKRFQGIPFSVIELKKSLEDLVENAP